MTWLKALRERYPLLWVTTAYLAEGIPFAMVIWVVGTMFKDLGHSDSQITVAVASVGVTWSLKPLWAGFLDLFKTKKYFVILTELAMAGLFVAVAVALQLDSYFAAIIALMWLVAFASATQDICVDGVYITSLSERSQARYIGFQSMAWNLGRVIAVSAAVWLAGYLQTSVGLEVRSSWMFVFIGIGALMVGFAGYHALLLPTGSRPASLRVSSISDVFEQFKVSALDFCDRPLLWGMLTFVLFFRSSEGLLLVEAPLFMQGCLEDGGLQLSLQDKGLIDGTLGTVANVIGGLLGGLFISYFGLRRTLFVLALCINVPNACFIYLAYSVTAAYPLSFAEIAFVVSLEKFWYGFGFVGNMLYMMQQLAPGRFRMTHYAFATALMNLVLVPTQMVSGPLADAMGFRSYFWVVMLAAIPSLLAAWFAPFPHADTSRTERSGDTPVRSASSTARPTKGRLLARRSTVLALLALALFLYVDTLILGQLSTTSDHATAVALLIILTLSTITKMLLGGAALWTGRHALALRSARQPSNARGAMICGLVMLAVSSVLIALTTNAALTKQGMCTLSPNVASCSTSESKATPKQCTVDTIER